MKKNSTFISSQVTRRNNMLENTHKHENGSGGNLYNFLITPTFGHARPSF